MYKLRYNFDIGSGRCLWAANDLARERFGYPVDLRELPLEDAVVLKGEALIKRYDTWMDLDNAPADLWSKAQWRDFDEDSSAFLTVLRAHLGADFEVLQKT